MTQIPRGLDTITHISTTTSTFTLAWVSTPRPTSTSATLAASRSNEHTFFNEPTLLTPNASFATRLSRHLARTSLDQ
jgi:hypothetical protein